MTDKERLEEIINRRPARWGNLTVKEFERDIKILQQQAERVEELEKKLSINTNNMKQLQKENECYKQRVEELEEENERLKVWYHSYQKESELSNKLNEQNKRYREALNSIITLWIASTDATDDTWLAHEMSETARKALEGKG